MAVDKVRFSAPYLIYALAAAVIGLAVLLQWLLRPWTADPTVLIFFLAAVLIFAASGMLFIMHRDRPRSPNARAALAEQRLALAQANTGVGIFELDFEAGTAFVSPSLCQMLGREVTPGEIDLALWLGGLRADHVEESRRVMQEHIARGEFRYEREQKIARPDGETRWVINRVELEADTTGVLRVARGVAVDITERKYIDERLQRAQKGLEQQLRDLGRLHNFSQNLVATGDDVPAAAQSLLDVTLELYGARYGIVSLIDPDNDDAWQTVAQAGFAVGAIERQAEESIHDRHRALAVADNFEGLQSLPLLSAQGKIMGLLSVMRPEPFEHCEREKRLAEVCAASAASVVERERVRAAAIKNERRFSVALESSVVPFTILTPVRADDGAIVDFVWSYVNPAAAGALGREVGDLIGQAITSLLPQAWDTPELFKRYVSVLDGDQQCEFEIQTAATNQGVRWYNVLAAPLQGSVAVWFTNITGRKQYEQNLREADRRKDEFVATLAHELRNPLAPIRQSVRIAAATNSSDAQRRWSHAVIERQVQHMSLLLDDLLDVSRVGRGTLLLRKSSEVLSVVIDTALEAARPHLEAKRHRLETSLPATPVILDIDPVRIAQVLGNLLTNAAKYTNPDGQIMMSAQREGEDFVIRIKDTGIGLTQEQQTQVFEMFSQAPAALEQSQGGLGIGLALARGLIELHGGSIRASSAGLGQGTEMIVRLPGSCVVAEGTVGSEPPTTTPVLANTDAKRSILIADDNVDAADSLAELLRLDGYEVYVAYDGAEALATFARVNPDAALLDVGMPRVSGLEVARAIRQQPTGQRAILIAVTGWGQERDRQLALEAGFDHHLTKPMMTEVICELIERSRISGTI